MSNNVHDTKSASDIATFQSKKNDISVCMIVKNEEKYLEQCLRSIQKIADEIIIIDTGSTDDTLEIARKYTDKIWIHPWNDSFSEARNHYLEYALGDWIFQIDADEELVQEDIPQVLSAVHDDSIDAIMIQIVNISSHGASKGVFNTERIFRNNGNIHYNGRVHNNIIGITAPKAYPIRFNHYGYDSSTAAIDKKFNRTASLLKKDLDENPDNPVTHHYLSCSYLSKKMYQYTIDHGLQAIRLADIKNNPDPMFLWTRYNVSLAYYRLNKLKLAQDMAQEALSLYPDHIDSHFLMIVISFDQKLWHDLIEHGNNYIRLLEMINTNPGRFGTLVSCSLNEAWNIHILLGIARYVLNDSGYSDSFQHALEIAPVPFLAARAAGIYLAETGSDREAHKYLDQANKLQPGDKTVQNLLIKLNSPQPRISCVMIVKNEEVFLEKCLLSIKDWVDEIIIVDTGSDDETVNIARRFTEKIYFHAWEGSFSKARNDAARHATGDWIFIIDGDEELIAGNGPKLREAIKTAGPADAFLITTVSIYGGGHKTARHNSERLFRNNGIIHYESIVHNRVVGCTCTKPTKIEIMHYGYNVDSKKANEKFIRTETLLKKQISESPDKPLPHHYLGTSYLAKGAFRECIVESEKAIELAENISDDHPTYLWSHQNAAMSYFYLGEIEKAKKHALRTLEKFAGYMDSYYTLTLIAGEQEDWEAVRCFGKQYLERLAFYEANSDKAGILINTTMGEGSSICLLIGHSWYRTGDTATMEICYKKAEELAQERWHSWYNAATYHMDITKDYSLAQELLEQALHFEPTEKKILYALAKQASLSKNRAAELEWLLKLWQAGSNDETVLNRLAVLLFQDGNTDGAIQTLESLLLNCPDNTQALLNIGIACKQQQNYPRAAECFMKLLEIEPENAKPWFHLSEISRALGQTEEADIFRARAEALASSTNNDI